MLAAKLTVARLLCLLLDRGNGRNRNWTLGLFVSLAVICMSPPLDAALVEQRRVASGLSQPVFVTHAPGDASRLFIVQRSGAIRLLNLNTGALVPTPFLSIPSVDAAGEGGLLGLAFHPDYATNGKFYTYSTHDNGGVNIGGAESPFSTHIRQYTVSSANPNVADTTFTPIINFPRPQDNHVGGWIDFSPDDGYLYIASGDGGGGDDNDVGHTPGMGNAQDKTNLLGKMLRLNVDDDDFPGTTPDALANNYAIPADNPFRGILGDDRIWAYGLRNPFRNSFDRANGNLWIGDVGQSTREEINFERAGDDGNNYGWRLREGTIATPTPAGSPVGGAKPVDNRDPVYDYTRFGELGGITVIGGYVYRGPDPSLIGQYFFGDAGQFGQPNTVKIWTFDPANPRDTVTNRNTVLPKDTGSGTRLASFGEDAQGNLYTVYVESGEVYRIVTDATASGDFDGNGRVDGGDLAAWRAGFGMVSGSRVEDGDADADGDVDGRDLLVWQRNVASANSAPSSEGVPEPAGAWLTAAACVAATIGRRNPGDWLCPARWSSNR